MKDDCSSSNEAENIAEENLVDPDWKHKLIISNYSPKRSQT
jgi:hypothetical protein